MAARATVYFGVFNAGHEVAIDGFPGFSVHVCGDQSDELPGCEADRFLRKAISVCTQNGRFTLHFKPSR